MARSFGSPRRALLHFLWIGGAAALVVRWLGPSPPTEPIVIERAAATADAAELRERIDEEILVREALARGLDVGDPVVAFRLARNAGFLGLGDADEGARAVRELGLARRDLVVRRRLAERMREEIEAPVRATEPGAVAQGAYLAAHRDRFERPRRVAFRHVFFSRDRRAEPVADARRALAGWRVAGTEPLGDAALAAPDQPLQTEADLARWFGAAFGAQLFELPLGEWAGPLEAPGGAHLVFVRDRAPARLPPLAEIEPRVRAALLDERADAAVRAFLAARRPAYEVRVAEERSQAGH